MQTFTIQITSNVGLKGIKDLKEKQAIKIVDEVQLDSPALPGKQLSLNAFKSWIASSEQVDSVSFKEAKSQWANKRKQLQSLIK